MGLSLKLQKLSILLLLILLLLSSSSSSSSSFSPPLPLPSAPLRSACSSSFADLENTFNIERTHSRYRGRTPYRDFLRSHPCSFSFAIPPLSLSLSFLSLSLSSSLSLYPYIYSPPLLQFLFCPLSTPFERCPV